MACHNRNRLFHKLKAYHPIPLTENEPGEEIDGVAPKHIVVTSELALLHARVNFAVFWTISRLVIWTAWKACVAMMSIRKVTEEQGMAGIR